MARSNFSKQYRDSYFNWVDWLGDFLTRFFTLFCLSTKSWNQLSTSFKRLWVWETRSILISSSAVSKPLGFISLKFELKSTIFKSYNWRERVRLRLTDEGFSSLGLSLTWPNWGIGLQFLNPEFYPFRSNSPLGFRLFAPPAGGAPK